MTAGHIGVTASGGVVTLTGHVDSYAKKLAAETAARRVKGVKAVAEEIEVRLPFDTQRSDADIAEAAIDRLGPGTSRFQKTASASKSSKVGSRSPDRSTGGIRRTRWSRIFVRSTGSEGVSNQTTIKPRVDTANLSDEITHALHRSWFFDPTHVHVRAEGGKIVLTGTVNSAYERQVAARTGMVGSWCDDRRKRHRRHLIRQPLAGHSGRRECGVAPGGQWSSSFLADGTDHVRDGAEFSQYPARTDEPGRPACPDPAKFASRSPPAGCAEPICMSWMASCPGRSCR